MICIYAKTRGESSSKITPSSIKLHLINNRHKSNSIITSMFDSLLWEYEPITKT